MPALSAHPTPAPPPAGGPVGSLRSGARLRAARSRYAAVLVLLVGSAPAWAAPESNVLEVTGMTFVGSRGTTRELVLRAEHATFHPDSDLAELEVVRAQVRNEEKGRSFDMTCDSADLNVETHDFVARGNVRGVTGDGQHYAAPWVRYENAGDLLYTDAPVEMVDDTGSFRGDGFRYHVEERRFQLLGHVTVFQSQ